MPAQTGPVKRDERNWIAWAPDLLYTGSRFESGWALVCDAEEGRIAAIARAAEMAPGTAAAGGAGRVVRLAGRAALPCLVNAHSHAFQRVIRGRTEQRRAGHTSDSFWTWREMMYRAAARLTPEDIYDASRMAFLEMALSGISAVGEFHYLHRTPDGAPYDDPNVMAKAVAQAAGDVGLRIALLRVAYARAGYQVSPDERQARFIEPEAQEYLRHVESLAKELAAPDNTPAVRSAWAGIAPHSVRAVPLDYLREVSAWADASRLPVHMHVAEQPAEVSACVREYGRTPVALLAEEGILGPRFTVVHGIHITHEEARQLARARSSVCACPTTERNLGDGIVPADLLFKEGARIALGTDSQAQIDLLEDARELEYHLRLQKLERAILAPLSEGPETARDAPSVIDPDTAANAGAPHISALATRLFECATTNGAASIGAPCGELAVGRAADFFTVDLDDPSIAGASAEDLLSLIVFSMTRAAVREVIIGGRIIIEAGRHPAQEEIIGRFAGLQRKLWSEDRA